MADSRTEHRCGRHQPPRAGGREESERLDFKRTVDLSSDAKKEEFLKDVTAMANRSGGTILIGVEDEDDKAVAVPGIDAEEARRLEDQATNLLRHRVEPRAYVGFETVEMGVGKVVLIVTIAPSFHPPHAVVSKGRRMIWRRAGKNSNPASVAEIREMAMVGATLNDRLRAFHDERVGVLEQGGDGRAAPFRSNEGYLIANLIPLGSFEDRREILDVFSLAKDKRFSLIKDMFRGGAILRHGPGSIIMGGSRRKITGRVMARSVT